jgi:long-chain acyl-CoA synthetase
MPFITRPTITQTFLERVKATPSSIGFQYKPTHPELGPVNTWRTVSFRDFYEECRIVSFGLMSLGVERGDKVAILSGTRYEWSLCDMAVLGAGAVTVPIYPSNTDEEVAYIVEHSESKVLILEDARQLEKVLALRARAGGDSRLRQLTRLVAIEPSAMAVAGASPARSPAHTKDVLTLQALKELGRREEGREPMRFEDNLRKARPEDLFTICYTSGTTGVPKGAMLTHDSLMSVLEDALAVLSEFVKPEAEVILSFLPFSHILGKVESLAIHTFGWRQAYAESMDKLMTNMAEVRPTVLFAVPRVFEKAFGRLQSVVDEGGLVKRALFNRAVSVGRRFYEAEWAKATAPLRVTAEYLLAQSTVLKKVKERFGGRLRFCISGGAPLPREIGEFFQIVGLRVLEGYGLTETCGPIAINTPDQLRFGSVGKPLPDVSVRIAPDGEILVQSRKVFAGYYKMPAETQEAFDAGWFRTGDIGHLDDEGFLRITDRKKDIIVTSAGKNVAPQKIENLAKTQPFISQFVVHGDRRHFLTALVTLDREQLIRYASENQILFSEYGELVKQPKILALVQRIIEEVNKQLASYETIKRFVILPTEFSIESGELTPSLKVRRSFINRKYREQLDSMYAENAARA